MVETVIWKRPWQFRRRTCRQTDGLRLWQSRAVCGMAARPNANAVPLRVMPVAAAVAVAVQAAVSDLSAVAGHGKTQRLMAGWCQAGGAAALVGRPPLLAPPVSLVLHDQSLWSCLLASRLVARLPVARTRVVHGRCTRCQAEVTWAGQPSTRTVFTSSPVACQGRRSLTPRSALTAV